MSALGLGLGLGACFNPASDVTGSPPGLGCTPGTFGCPCDNGACGRGLVCVQGQCEPAGGSAGTTAATTDEVPGGPTTGAVDTGRPGTTTAMVDTGVDSTGGTTEGVQGSSSGPVVPPAMETVDFPTPDDERMFVIGDRPWNAGDYYEGQRDTMVPSISALALHLAILENGLSACGFQEMEVSINGVPVGNFVVSEAMLAVDEAFAVMPPIDGPSYTIRYETVATVESGCGSALYDEMSSTVTFFE